MILSGNVIGANSRHDNSLGVSLYVSAAGVDDQQQIQYRNFRPMCGHVLPSGASWDPAVNFLHDAAVSIAVSPTNEISYALPAAYNGTTFWAQVRTHSNGVENETLFRPQRITVDGSGNGSGTIDGAALILDTQKRDAGGMRVRFIYLPATTGLAPVTFTISRTAGPTSPADVSTSYIDGALEYSIDVDSLQDAGAYTFELKATNGAAEKVLATVNFTADASGPGIVQGLATEVC